jgi:hypothetical protein
MFRTIALVAAIAVAHSACAQTSNVPPPSGNAPTITNVVAMPMGWKVSFTAVPGALNYAVTDPSQHWFSTQGGSAHITSASPAFVQGAGGAASASFAVAAQTSSGWTKLSASSRTVSLSGSLPAFSDPYWIYHAGTYYWSGDFSQPGGDTGTILPQFGGTGAAPNPNTIKIEWFYTGDSAFPAGAVRIQNPVSGNFSPAIPGLTIDLGAHPYAYWIAAVKPTYAGADYNLKLESLNDEVVTNVLPSLKQYVTAPTAGVFTQNAINRINVPMSALALHANKTDGKRSIYKIVFEQNQPTAGTWLVDDLGFANAPR